LSPAGDKVATTPGSRGFSVAPGRSGDGEDASIYTEERVPNTDRDVAERRTEQTSLYGASVDVIAERIGQHVGLEPRDIARVIGVSFPMFNEVLSGRRVRIGNPVATSRLGMLRDFAGQLESGEADPADIDLTLRQIRASTLAPPVLTTPASRRSGSGVPLGPGGTPSGGAPSGTPSYPPPGAPSHPPSNPPSNAPSGAPSGTPSGPQASLLSRATLDAALRVVRPHVPPSPVHRWPLLEQVTGAETWVKQENTNPTGAFKVRGGLNFVARLKQAQPKIPGLISATRGNHGQSLAYAGRAQGVPVTIVVPEGNSPDKNAAIAAYGAELIVFGRDFQAAAEHAASLARERGLLMVPPFHRWLVEGVATYAAELHETVPGLDVIYVPVGMGSGICANILVRDLIGARTEIVGVVSELAPAYALSFEARKPVSTPDADTFVDGVACRTPDREAVSIIARGASRFVRVSEAQAAEAMALVYRTTHQLAEPAGSVALAGLLAEKGRIAGKRVAFVHTGGNCDFDVLQRALA